MKNQNIINEYDNMISIYDNIIFEKYIFVQHM